VCWANDPRYFSNSPFDERVCKRGASLCVASLLDLEDCSFPRCLLFKQSLLEPSWYDQLCVAQRGTVGITRLAPANVLALVRDQDRADAPSVWKLEDPETLQKERNEKKAAVDAAAKLKLERKRDSKVSTESSNPSIPQSWLLRHARGCSLERPCRGRGGTLLA
jgi:hypothetical protein